MLLILKKQRDKETWSKKIYIFGVVKQSRRNKFCL